MKIDGITLFPFIFIIKDPPKTLLNHETIHFIQAKETFIIPFYIIYLFDFIKHYIKYRDTNKAYHLIRFEREAYANQFDDLYLNRRQKHNWRKYNYVN